jgi:hypothetical protein
MFRHLEPTVKEFNVKHKVGVPKFVYVCIPSVYNHIGRLHMWDFHLLFYTELLERGLERLKHSGEIKQIRDFNFSVHTISIQDVTGGTDNTSGVCSLGQTIPI